MTLGNMRANGLRRLSVRCEICHHSAVLDVDGWPDDTPVPSFGPRMVCTACGLIGADARSNRQEAPRGGDVRTPKAEALLGLDTGKRLPLV